MASLDKAFIKAYRQQESAIGAIPIGASEPESPPVQAQTATETADDIGGQASMFQPLLQVERMTASSVGRRLRQRAADELNRLADAVVALGREGNKTIGFAAGNPGQGTTTLLGAVALCLAERGVRVAAVDADVADPQLALELGLAPEYGWERVLEGSCPCEELVIESAKQPIAIMPLCRRTETAGLPDDFTPFRDALDTLREHYDLVLIDLGVPGDGLMDSILKTVDSVLLVRSSRTEQVHDRHGTLGRAGVDVAGIVETFVRSG